MTEELTKAAQQSCHCQTCQPITMDNMRMVLCPTCGNKRCPHANDHRNACTGSNEPGQPGSAYPDSALDHRPAAQEMVAVAAPIEPSGLHYSMAQQAAPSTIEQRLRTILNGIDKDETEDEAGWWETSDGAALGARKLAEVLDAVRQATPEPVRLGALMELTAERNKLQAALEIACSHLTDEQAAQVAAAMPDTADTPEPVQWLIDALDWISDNGPDDAYELRQHARDALEAFRTATPEPVGEPVGVLVSDEFDGHRFIPNGDRWPFNEPLYTRPAPAPAVPEVDDLAQFIRQIDGKHSMGAGALADHICEWLAAAQAKGVQA